MNTVAQNITYAVAGLVVGGTVGFIVANKRAEIQLKNHLDAMDAAYQDAFDRAMKTGPYATVEAAAAVLVPVEVIADIKTKEEARVEEEAEAEAAAEAKEAEEHHIPKHLIESYSATDPIHIVGHPKDVDDSDEEVDYEQDDTEEEESEVEDVSMTDDEDPDAISNLAAFVERYKDKPVADFGKVTFPGQVHDDEEEDAPISSVPGFVTVRDPNGPYVISIDEAMEDDSPFTLVEMTYFEGDDTLIDSRETPISDPNEIDKLVGHKNLDKWGQGTTDPDMVYIRNERLEIDIEVTKDDRTYTRVILGIIPEDEIARSMIKPLKMRDGDGD